MFVSDGRLVCYHCLAMGTPRPGVMRNLVPRKPYQEEANN
jgi:hypothetical protein